MPLDTCSATSTTITGARADMKWARRRRGGRRVPVFERGVLLQCTTRTERRVPQLSKVKMNNIRGYEQYVKDFPERRAELDALGFRWNSLAW